MEWTLTVTKYKDGKTVSFLEGVDDKVGEALYDLAKAYGYDAAQHQILQLKQQIETKQILAVIVDILKDL